MEYFVLNGERYSISNAPLINSSPPGFRIRRNPQPLDGSLQLHQKKKNPADNERISADEMEGFMISSEGAQEVRRPQFHDFKFAEATSVTTTALRPPPSAGLDTSASLSVNGGGTAKVGKKRSRASRRAPTTLLKTDTSNFRAMVQRFTGIPETPFGYPVMNPSFSPHVGQQDWQLVPKPLPYKAVFDLNMNYASHLHSVPESYVPQQYNHSTFIPFQSLHDYTNISSPNLNFLPNAPRAQSSNATLLHDAGLIKSASLFPTPAITLSSHRRPPAYDM